MNRLDAIKYFVVASETLNFRATAERFAVSPQVITRVIGELENELGEQLFKRNTRSIRLTEFASDWLPKAEQFLQQETALFGVPKIKNNELSGVVRITVPPSAYSDWLLKQLLIELEPFPDIRIDWRSGFESLHAIEDQIDIGIRIKQSPEDHWIAKKIRPLNEPIVATPALLEKLGQPENVADLIARFPIGSLLNKKTNRAWQLMSDSEFLPIPETSVLVDDNKTLLQAVLSGRFFAQLPMIDCQPYLQSGELVQVFPNSESQKWAYYLYRPSQTITAKRVLKVFEILEGILRREM